MSQTISAPDRRSIPTLDEEDLRELAPRGRQESYAAGMFLLEFGQQDVDLLVIESGRVEVLNPTDGNRRIASRGPGEFIGDIDLITRRPVVYSVRSLGAEDGGPTRVLRVPGEAVRLLMNSAPQISEKLIEAFQFRRQRLEGGKTLGLRLLGPPGCGHTHQMREFLHKNFVPFTWIDTDSPDGREAVAALGSPGALPAVDFGTGNVMFRPTLAQVASAVGVLRDCPERTVDLAIVGAGPAGIAAAVYAASEGINTIVLDRLGPGGQIGGSSRIENFIGFPAGLSGTDLSTRGVLQMLKFGAEMLAPVAVEHLIPSSTGEGLHELQLDCGTRVHARVVLACTGVAWRRLPAKDAPKYERSGIFYTCTAVESQLYEDCDVAVVGAGNSAGQAVVFMADRHPDRRVHVLARRDLSFTMSEYLVRRIQSARNVQVHLGVEVESVEGGSSLESVRLVHTKSGERSTLKVGAVFVFIGAQPHSDWLPEIVARDKHGFLLTGSDVVAAGLWPRNDRPPCPLETSIPGVLAGGDLRSGSTKRVGFAVGDGSLAVTCTHHLLGLTG